MLLVEFDIGSLLFSSLLVIKCQQVCNTLNFEDRKLLLMTMWMYLEYKDVFCRGDQFDHDFYRVKMIIK